MAIRRLPSTGDAPRNTGVPESLVAGGSGDSAGFPWEGRTFDHHETAFADDSGLTPDAYSAAVASVRAAVTAADAHALSEATAGVLTALNQIRVLIPMVADAGDLGVTPSGAIVEKTQELSIVTVSAPDGRTAMPVFTSVETMRRWNATARPIPVPGPQAALAAAQEETDLIIVDPGTPELEFGVRRTQIEAMATGEHCVPGWADPAVGQAFSDSVVSEVNVVAVELRAADPTHRLLAPEIDVVLQLRGGLPREELTGLLGRVQTSWAQSDVIAHRVDSLRVLPRSANPSS